MNGHDRPELFDSDEEEAYSDYFASIAADAERLARDPDYATWLQQMELDARRALDMEAGF